MHKKLVTSIAIVNLLLVSGLLNLLPGKAEVTNAAVSNQKSSASKLRQVKKFTSVSDFKNYLKKAGALNGNRTGVATLRNSMALEKSMDQAAGAAPERVSETNVQVSGIDEPDIVKTDGNTIYLSSPKYYSYLKETIVRDLKIAPVTGIREPDYGRNIVGEIKMIKSWPTEELGISGKVNASGDMLLKNNILVVFSDRTIFGFDVSDKANPKEVWKIELGKRDRMISARLYNEKIYLATNESINYSRPCPFQPLTANGKAIIIPCGQIYHPVVETPTDIVYNVFTIDLKSGSVGNKVSFTGSSQSSVLYMSPTAIFVSYFYPGDMMRFSYNFLSENRDLVPATVLERLSRVQNLDISQGSKQNEFYHILNEWQNELEDDERMRIQNEMQNRFATYYPGHLRELEQTGVVKINLDDLKIKGVGTVPGSLLNQFSMDEYQNNLRIATTVGQGFWSFGWFSSSAKTSNDVYVLNDSMNTVGSVKDLGKDERIYSARFIGDKGYLVTFKQIDPFYVLDLSNPSKPEVKGELKIPGYSGYLEALGGNIILGVGKEDNKVKAALFDVSNPSNPVEVSKFILDEYWSEALSNHRAFLKDDKHKVFFIPGSKGGYVFSYADNKLSLVKTVSGYSVQRAVYINDALYIIGQNKITVLNENNWETVKELTLE